MKLMFLHYISTSSLRLENYIAYGSLDPEGLVPSNQTELIHFNRGIQVPQIIPR